MNKILLILSIIGVAIGAFYYFFLYFPPGELITLYTTWGENLDKYKVLQEYPRPQFERKSYMNLNGIWKYALLENDSTPTEYDGDVLVPFSIETPLSVVKSNSFLEVLYGIKEKLTFLIFQMKEDILFILEQLISIVKYS